MAKNINILLTCVGGGLVPRAIELLKESEAFEFRVIGIDTSKAIVILTINLTNSINPYGVLDVVIIYL